MRHALDVVESVHTYQHFPSFKRRPEFSCPPSHGSALQSIANQGRIDANREHTYRTEPAPELDPFRRRRRNVQNTRTRTQKVPRVVVGVETH